MANADSHREAITACQLLMEYLKLDSDPRNFSEKNRLWCQAMGHAHNAVCSLDAAK